MAQEFYREPWNSLALGDTRFVHRGDCEFEIIRQPEGSFMPWSVHSMIEGSTIGLGRKTACRWTQGDGVVSAEIARPGIGRLLWRFFPGPKGLLRFTMTVVNESPEDRHDIFVNVHNFPSPRLFRGERTFVEADGCIREVRELWSPGREIPQGVYPFAGKNLAARFRSTGWIEVPCRITSPFVYRIGGGNEPTAHACWCENRPVVAGMICEHINAVLMNLAWPCLDLEMDFGDVPAGAKVSQHGLIGILEGTGEDFLECFRSPGERKN